MKLYKEALLIDEKLAKVSAVKRIWKNFCHSFDRELPQNHDKKYKL